MRSFFAELKRRNVFAAMAFYAAAGWLLVQVATQVLPFYDTPEWVVRLVIAAVVIGFPFAMVLSWFYEWTPRGWRRESEADPAGSNGVVSVIATDQSIAVLPFADMSMDKDQEYFSDGLAEELLNLLAQLPQLRVIARTSSFSFKGKDADVATIARALHVATVLEGSVRKSGNTLRVTAQLIRAADSSHLWSQSYDRELVDVFRVQDEIARAVVDALKLKLLPGQQLTHAHRTASTEAYELCLHGQSALRNNHRDDYGRALVLFQRALALDPDYATAHAGLAAAQSALADFACEPEQLAEGKRQALVSAERAIALAPDLADGYAIRGQLYYRNFWDWPRAEQDYRRALELDPRRIDALTGYALAMFNGGRLDECLALVRRATAIDPLSLFAWFLLGGALHRAGRDAESRAALTRALEINQNSSFPHMQLGEMTLDEGDAEAALEHFHRAGPGYSQYGIAIAEHTLGHAAASRAALDELTAHYSAGFAFQIAQVHAWRGENDAAFEWLERAYAQHDPGLLRIRHYPHLKSLAGDPRYAAMLRKLNYPSEA
jgi:serine/threonine-protein kinase